MVENQVEEKWRFPRTSQEAQAFVNPNLRTRFLRIDNAFALVHEGIPVSQETKKMLFGSETNGTQPTFDSIDLATDEGIIPITEAYLQRLIIFIKMKSIFTSKDPLEEDFLRTIQQNPDKPFLIINGHGTARFKNIFDRLIHRPRWFISEEHQTHGIFLENLFKKIDLKKYSAILLVSCNEKGILPPQIPETPIYFVKGNAGIPAYEKRSSVKRS